MNKKNVLYIFNDKGFGGAAQSLLDILTGIKDKVNPIVVVREDVIIEEKFIEAGIKYYKIRFFLDYVKIGTVDENKKAYDLVRSYEAAMQLMPIIKKEDIQLIHINSSVTYFGAIAALMARIPYVWHIRELPEEQFGWELLNEELIVNLFKQADRLITISDYVKKSYYKKYNLETIKMYDGLNIKRYKKNMEIQKEFNYTFIAPGAITPGKGQLDIVKAAEILAKRGFRGFKIIIVGNGSDDYVWALEKYIKRKNLDKNICILPYCDDLSSLRSQASYAITSSQNEALGRVTIEAMLAGNFMIGAESGGTAEIIGDNEERGILYELHNSEALADAMMRAIECPAEDKKWIMKAAQEYVEKKFDSKMYCERLNELYDSAVLSYKPKDQKNLLDTLKKKHEKNRNIELHECQDAITRYKKSEAALGLALKWLMVKQKGHRLSEYFEQKGIKSIAIYGMADMGKRLYDELEESDIEIRYLLDKAPKQMDKILTFSSPDQERLETDAIIVTVALAEKQIIDELMEQGYEKVIGLSEVLGSFNKEAINKWEEWFQ